VGCALARGVHVLVCGPEEAHTEDVGMEHERLPCARRDDAVFGGAQAGWTPEGPAEAQKAADAPDLSERPERLRSTRSTEAREWARVELPAAEKGLALGWLEGERGLERGRSRLGEAGLPREHESPRRERVERLRLSSQLGE
jgi:hypothetical protein